MKKMPATHATPRWTIGWARRSLFALAISAIAACGGASDGPSAPGVPVVPVPATPVGSYDIQTVNGSPVPVVVSQDGTFKLEFTAGTVSLGADAKYTVVLTTRYTIPGNVQTFVDSTAGTWVQTGNSIQLTDGSDASKTTGTWDKGLLTFVSAADKATYIYYQKR